MPEWITHHHAGFVLAAYIVAAIALVGIGLASWRAHRHAQKTLQKLSHPKAQ